MSNHPTRQLLAHTPWTDAVHEEELRRATDSTKRSAARSERLMKGLFTAGAACVCLAILKLNADAGSEAVNFGLLAMGCLLLFAGMRQTLAHEDQAWLLARWRRDEGVDRLGDRDLQELYELARQRPETAARIASWDALGLKLRERDRTVIETYLSGAGIDVPGREEVTIADKMEPEAA